MPPHSLIPIPHRTQPISVKLPKLVARPGVALPRRNREETEGQLQPALHAMEETESERSGVQSLISGELVERECERYVEGGAASSVAVESAEHELPKLASGSGAVERETHAEVPDQSVTYNHSGKGG